MKVNFAQSLDGYQARHHEFREIDLPPTQYLMLDGHGDPNSSPEFTHALEALYPVAYKLKFVSKASGRDYVVPPLEGLWWSNDMDAFTTSRDKSRWDWTLMIMTPEWIDAGMVDGAIAAAAKKQPVSLSKLRLRTLDEGRCVQTLHVGSFDDEAGILDELHNRYIPEAGLTMTGQHHEVYLTDSRRTPPAKQRTILRQPVSSKQG